MSPRHFNKTVGGALLLAAQSLLAQGSLQITPLQGLGAIGVSREDVGRRLTFACPASDGTTGSVYGTDTYTADSAICVAAVHAGAITAERGGVVTVTQVPRLSEYAGTTRFGVASTRRSAAPDAFRVAPTAVTARIGPGPSANPTLQGRAPPAIAANRPAAELPPPAGSDGQSLVSPVAETAPNAPAASNAMFAKPVATAPTGFSASFAGPGGSGGAVRLSWQPVTDALKYRLEGPGIANGNLTVPASTQGVTVNDVPPGAQSWRIAAVYANEYWDANAMATATAMLRFMPSHTPAWLTRNNGAGTATTAMRHYQSLCSTCVPGITFRTFTETLGLRDGHFGGWPTPTAMTEWIWQWERTAERYENVTEFGTVRGSWCNQRRGWGTSYILCYSLSGPNADQGMSVIVKLSGQTWFLSFDSPGPGSSPFDHVLADRATLDSQGPRHLPHNCLSCHGGTYDGATGRVNGATLLPLDPTMLKGGVASAFLAVNKTVMDTLPSQAVDRHLRSLYRGDPRTLSNPYARDYVPPGWANQTALYSNIVRPYCLMCHLATPANQDFISSSAAFFNAKAQIHNAVCVQRSMPHAEVPFRGFWTKDTGATFLPGVLAAVLGYASCP